MLSANFNCSWCYRNSKTLIDWRRLMKDRDLILGFEIRDDYSQLSYTFNLLEEPESISKNEDEEQFLIPSVVGLKKDSKQWVFGEEALDLQKKGQAQVITNLLDKIIKDHRIKIYGQLYEPTYLIERFIYKILMELKFKWPDQSIKQMVVTTNKTNPEVSNALYEALKNLGIDRDRARVISYPSSYLAYILVQDKEIWMNDVVLFDFGEDGFTYFQLSLEKRRLPHIAKVRSKDYSDMVNYDEFSKSNKSDNFEYLLENIINDALYMQIVSSIYFTGKGFIEGISAQTIKKISKGRRIFIGQNLYCKGACYFAGQLAGGDKLDNFVFLLEDTAHYSVRVIAYDNDRQTEIQLNELGYSIYEPPKKLDLIIDDEEKLRYQVIDKQGLAVLEDTIVLDDLPNRPSKTSRIEVGLVLISSSRFKIKIKDKGFGELYPATDKTWEKEVVIHG